MRTNRKPAQRVRVSRRVWRGSLVGLVAATAMVAGAVSASAAPGDGSAYGVRVDVDLLGRPAVELGPLAAASTDGPTEDTFAAVNLPGVLTTGVINTSASRDDSTGHVAARASTADVDLAVFRPANPVTAELVEATCEATQAGNTGSTNLVGVQLGSLGDIAADPAPNTVVNVRLGAVHIASITFNEQIANDDGSLTVNAIHVRLLGARLGSLGSGDVIISSATCGPAAPPIPMASGLGLWLSVGVLGVVAVTAATVVLRRRAAMPAAAGR